MLLKGAYCAGEHFVDPQGTVTVRASQYMIILLNVKTQSSYKGLPLITC